MRSKLSVVALLVLAGASRPQAVQAQGGVVAAGFAVGARARVDSLDIHSRGKFEEYRQVPVGPFLEAARIRYAPGDGYRSYTAVARELGERDQSAWIGANMPGRWNALVRWDRIPHTFSSTARMLGQESSPGVFTLPNPRPTTANWNAAPYIDPVRSQWDPVRASFTLTPSSRWDLKAEFTWLGKTGSRPMGMAMGSPGNNFREIPEPIDQSVHSLRLSESYAGRRFHVQLSYDFSRFSNSFSSVTADNPLVATDGATTGPSRGRTALAPNNTAHTLLFTGAVSLPRSTRVTASMSYGLRRQNQEFLPATINSAIVSPLLDEIPTSLHGDVRTTMINVAANSRPLRALTLTGRVRHYSLSDHTGEIELPAYVLNDRSLTIGELIPERYPHSKDNADAGATYRITDWASLTGGYFFERWERNAPSRNTRHTNEHGGRAAVNLDPVEWLQVRGSFSDSRRRIVGEYLAVTEDQLPTLRRFDQANRNQRRWEVLTQFSPLDAFSLTGLLGGSKADFPDSEFGLQLQKSTLVGGEAEWSPVKQVSLGMNYTREVFRSRQRAKYREPTQPDNPTYDWVSTNDDFIDTFGASATAEIIPGRVEVGGMLELSKARLVNKAFNPIPPTGGTAAQNASASASPWPDITQKWLPASIFAQVEFTRDWAASLRFTYDKFNKKDFRTDGLLPATGADIFMGNDYRDYRAQFLTFVVSYRAGFLRGRRSAL